MQTDESLKELVRSRYTEIAGQNKSVNDASCCGSGCCTIEVYNIISDDYTALEGYNPDADLGLGCGLPTEFACIKPGDTVVDLGSGAGNDCFIARAQTGGSGKVIGIDFTPAMIAKARVNAEKLGYNNVEFRQGDIEQMPIGADVADVVVSNCVLNLVPDKAAVLREIFRVLKPGGHFSISDIVLEGTLPAAIRQAAEMYAGCVSGAIGKSAYLTAIHACGFESVTVQKEKVIYIPDDILRTYLSADEIASFRSGTVGIHSITVFARKPNFCTPGSGCC